MSESHPATPLSPEESARVVALSATIAGGVLFLYFVDVLALGWFDPLSLYMRMLMEVDPRYTAARKYTSLVLVGIWGVCWFLSGLDSIRSRGRRRLAIAAVAILILGIVVSLKMNSDVRNFTLRGVGYSP